MKNIFITPLLIDVHSLCYFQEEMNAWLMLWLTKTAHQSRQYKLLSIDSFKTTDYSRDDVKHPFFKTLTKTFGGFMQPGDFGNSSVCFTKLILQPHPLKDFLMGSWHMDNVCGFIGPSSIYQRWNVHVHRTYSDIYDLYHSTQHHPRSINTQQYLHKGRLRGKYQVKQPNNRDYSDTAPFHSDININISYIYHDISHTPRRNDIKIQNKQEIMRVLVVMRNETTRANNGWLEDPRCRNFQNLDEIITGIDQSLQKTNLPYELSVVNLRELSYESQVYLFAHTSIVVAMHGAGFGNAVAHLPIGSSAYCCAALEIFPHGIYTPIRGFGNLARHLGIYYDRIDITPKHSNTDGALVSPEEISVKLNLLIETMTKEPTCLLPSVVNDPFLQSIQSPFANEH